MGDAHLWRASVALTSCHRSGRARPHHRNGCSELAPAQVAPVQAADFVVHLSRLPSSGYAEENRNSAQKQGNRKTSGARQGAKEAAASGAGHSDNACQRSFRKDLRTMNRHGNAEGMIVPDHDVVASFDSVEPESKVAERADGVLAGNGRNRRHQGSIRSSFLRSPNFAAESGIRLRCDSID